MANMQGLLTHPLVDENSYIKKIDRVIPFMKLSSKKLEEGSPFEAIAQLRFIISGYKDWTILHFRPKNVLFSHRF